MRLLILIMLLCSLLLMTQPLVAQSSSDKNDDETNELEELRRKAASEATEEETSEKKPEEQVFKSGGLSLQALNPEISVTGDMIGYHRKQTDVRKESEFLFRGLGLHLETYLDPYSRFNAAAHFNKDTTTLGEAYLTRFGILKDVNLTIGKFRQQFGVVNRWHKHGLDQVDFPMPLRMIFGDGGLNQIGLSADWIMPQLGKSSQELTVQLTNGENARLFGGNTLGRFCSLAHYKNYRDLTKDTYLEVGLTGLLGSNDEWEIGPVTKHEREPVSVVGADITVLWEPTERMRYRNLVWRTEAYCLNKDIIAPDGSEETTIKSWGAYTYVETKLSRIWHVGLRGGYYQPDTKRYAAVVGASLAPLAVTKDDAYTWQVGPYVTWWQSPFVKYRLEYNYVDNDHMGIDEDERLLMFQMIFAAGPHKHERY